MGDGPGLVDRCRREEVGPVTERASDAVGQQLLERVALGRRLPRLKVALVDSVLRQNGQPRHRVDNLERQAVHGRNLGHETGEVILLRQVDDLMDVGDYRAGRQVLLQVFDELFGVHVEPLLGWVGDSRLMKKVFS